MSVVVTGGAGFIGQVLVAQLRAEETPVVTIDRRPSATPAGVTALTADLLSGAPEVEAALRGASAVIHLAGCSGVRDAGADVHRRRQRDNVDTARVLASLVPPDVPVVAASSSSVYGGARHGRPCRETDEAAPVGGYAESKHRAEQVWADRARRGGHVLVVRPFTVVGEGQRADMALPRWADAAAAGEPLRVFGSLERTRDVTCVREVARGLRALLHTGATGRVNLGSGVPRSLRDIIGALSTVLGLEVRVQVEPADPREVADTWADTTRFAQLVGWTPRTDLHDVVRRFVAGRCRNADAQRSPKPAAVAAR